MSERVYKLAELGITEEAARDLMRGRAVVVPAPRWVKLDQIEVAGGALLSELEWPARASFAYDAMVSCTPYGMANVPKMPLS